MKLEDIIKLLFNNEKYTLYYDETNNPLKIQYKKDNSLSKDKFKYNYCLGGIAYNNKPTNNIEDLIKSLNFQKNFTEMKIDLVCKEKDDIIGCIKSNKLNTILKWIKDNNLYIHGFIFNNMYDIAVEIIDSLFANKNNDEIINEIFNIKSSFYNFINNNWDEFSDILIKYNYPNINNPKLFLNEIIDLINKNNNDFYLILLVIIIKLNLENELVFLTENEEKTIIDSYAVINFERLSTLPNSYHHFDHIVCIKEKLDTVFPNENKRNYDFLDSKKDFYIQLSDVIINIVYRFYDYLNNDIDVLKKDINSLNDLEKENLYLLINILEYSNYENRKFICRYDSPDLINKQNNNFEYLKNTLTKESIKVKKYENKNN